MVLGIGGSLSSHHSGSPNPVDSPCSLRLQQWLATYPHSVCVCGTHIVLSFIVIHCVCVFVVVQSLWREGSMRTLGSGIRTTPCVRPLLPTVSRMDWSWLALCCHSW